MLYEVITDRSADTATRRNIDMAAVETVMLNARFKTADNLVMRHINQPQRIVRVDNCKHPSVKYFQKKDTLFDVKRFFRFYHRYSLLRYPCSSRTERIFS